MKGFEEILDEVCFSYSYTSFKTLQDNLKHPTGWGHKELKQIIEDVAREYSKQAERYYKVNEELEGEILDLEDKVENLESQLDDLEYELSLKDSRILELEVKLDILEGRK